MAKIANGSKQLKSKPQPAAFQALPELRAQIEKLAYQFFVDRGYQHGYDHEDWARAEAIVKNQN